MELYRVKVELIVADLDQTWHTEETIVETFVKPTDDEESDEMTLWLETISTYAERQLMKNRVYALTALYHYEVLDEYETSHDADGADSAAAIDR
jgi:hypothetical protein